MGGAGLKVIATAAFDRDLFICRVYILFHLIKAKPYYGNKRGVYWKMVISAMVILWVLARRTIGD